jgi:hypothetical protein
MMSNSRAGRLSLIGQYLGQGTIISAISVDISANMAYVLKHEGPDEGTQ